jgi:prephenate dehydratase
MRRFDAVPAVVSVGFQGESGAFSDEAAHQLVSQAETRGYRTFDELVASVDRAEVDYGLLPVENSIYGAIARSYDLLWEYPALRIVDEIVFPVVQNLIGTLDAGLDDIEEVRSHPVALEQVRRLFDEHPGWRRIVVDDTAAAVAQVVSSGDKTIAAIASAFAARRYNAQILRAAVQDDDDNFTRFFLLQREGSARRALGRACVALELPNVPGSLRNGLAAFADRAINLRSLVSRPSRSSAFSYRFYCEIEDVDADRLIAALTAIDGDTRIFGVY